MLHFSYVYKLPVARSNVAICAAWWWLTLACMLTWRAIKLFFRTSIVVLAGIFRCAVRFFSH
jgi:hypothetical protein